MNYRQHWGDTRPATYHPTAAKFANSEAHLAPCAMTTIQQRLMSGRGKRRLIQLLDKEVMYLGQNLQRLIRLVVQQHGVGQIMVTDHHRGYGSVIVEAESEQGSCPLTGVCVAPDGQVEVMVLKCPIASGHTLFPNIHGELQFTHSVQPAGIVTIGSGNLMRPIIRLCPVTQRQEQIHGLEHSR